MEKQTILLKDDKIPHKYYAVHCRCGHVGVNNYIKIVFPVIAKNGKDAAARARQFARVKHDKKNAIIDCYEITHGEYEILIQNNKNDPYLKCKNIQEQKLIDGFASRVIKEPEKVFPKKSKKERRDFVTFKLRKQKQIIEALTRTNLYKYSVEKGNQLYEIVY